MKKKASREGRVGERILAATREEHRQMQKRINQRNSIFPRGTKFKVVKWPELP